ncbi:hypothetical protein Vafri_15240 [Volvox africanus]|uniref:Uncharacterized protein n=1 Tax=Volvox africanus TaxID=51714 RepID=A0A8J4BFS7_9CHLO|nr:hypothetical protein Vafri_15240 [Volvox africanus]
MFGSGPEDRMPMPNALAADLTTREATAAAVILPHQSPPTAQPPTAQPLPQPLPHIHIHTTHPPPRAPPTGPSMQPRTPPGSRTRTSHYAGVPPTVSVAAAPGAGRASQPPRLPARPH